MEVLLKTILWLSLGGTLLGALLMLLRRLTGRRISSGFYYYAWLIVLLRFLLPLPGLLPIRTATAPAAEPAPTAAVAALPPASDAAYGARRYSAGRAGGQPSFVPPSESAAPAISLPAEQPAEKSGTDWAAVGARALALLRSRSFWGAVYLSGCALSALWYFGGYARFKRRLSRLLKPARGTDLELFHALYGGDRLRLCRSEAVRTPMLLGLIHPLVVLPDRGYSPEQLSGILRHELTHYKRGDLLYKWFAAAVFTLHWFNPFTALFRREIDRACELSCDERLLRDMDSSEKQRYGDTLISLAADRSLPRSVVAMSLATEKQNLKERLVQIMTYRKTGKAGLALMLAAILLLAGCAGALGPAATAPAEESPAVEAESLPPTPEAGTEEVEVSDVTGENIPEEHIIVHDVDELLAAIGPDRVIQLPAGEFDLTEATGYGDAASGSAYWSWAETYDGSELVIRDVKNLYIVGMDNSTARGQTRLVTQPRYANVLNFKGCENVGLVGLTIGHTVETGSCTGGVLDFADSSDMLVTSCSLYGCGILGLRAENCRRIHMLGTEIYECSEGAVQVRGCYDVLLELCRIYDCGGSEWTSLGYDLFSVSGTTGFALLNSDVKDNKVRCVLRSEANIEVLLGGCSFTGNIVGERSESRDQDGNPYIWANGAFFSVSGQSPVVSGCELRDNGLNNGWYFNWAGSGEPGVCVDADGNELQEADFLAMERNMYYEAYLGPHVPEQTAPEGGERSETGEMVYHVDNMDDFLAAIGPDTVIVLDEGLFDFTTATNYGGYGGSYYYWIDLFDGPGLVITGVENLSIIGQGKDKTTLQVEPRYADVLCFDGCSNIRISDLTAGHRKDAPGSCAGNVFTLQNCGEVTIENCGLFGCGVVGLQAQSCSGFTVRDTEIYECSTSGLSLGDCDHFVFEGCVIRDCPIGGYLHGVSDLRFDGCAIRGCEYDAISLYGGARCTWNDADMSEGNNFA